MLYMRPVLSLSREIRFYIFIAAALFVGGAIGMELIGAKYAEAHGVFNLPYSMLTTVEESMELAGLIVFIYALLRHIADNYKQVNFDFE